MLGRRRVVHVLGVYGWELVREGTGVAGWITACLHWEGLEVCVYLYSYGYLCAIAKRAVLLAIKA